MSYQEFMQTTPQRKKKYHFTHDELSQARYVVSKYGFLVPREDGISFKDLAQKIREHETVLPDTVTRPLAILEARPLMRVEKDRCMIKIIFNAL